MATHQTQHELYKGDGKMKFLWDSGNVGQMYAIVERLTLKFAESLLRQAKVVDDTSDSKLIVLDEACGTGAVSAKLLDLLSDDAQGKLDLTMIDGSPTMLDLVHKRIESNNWGKYNIKVIQVDANDTKLPSAQFTHVFLSFGPMIFPDPQVGLFEIYRLLKPGGTVGLSSHSKIGWISDVIAAWKTDPDLPPFPTNEGLAGVAGPHLKWNEPAWIKETLDKVGFVDIEIVSCPVYHVESNATETFQILLPGTVGMIINTMWTQEQRDEMGQKAKDVSVRYIQEKYGDGDLGWDWCALLITARKPAQ
ncbi:hypothetical protein LTR84_002212 [Exophiala bonariae]|uniref:Methyltransferase domain-containing protein n=1 Tax=Exophiala bonariae TaxID=1690606 RepID=A0AAV9NBM7_9EURO|nr:hypothetical protein LTR84_002212 [Exophiala bonariae]